jgi:hypothetical protein
VSYWNQRAAVLHLSQSGRELFAELPNGKVLEVFVEWADELGLWIFHKQVNDATTSVRLVKWTHFESAVLDVVAEEPEPAKVIGFRGRKANKTQSGNLK